MADDDELCDLCGLFEAEYREPVEKGDTGEKADANLCPDCHEKAIDYAHGLDVDWSPEIRLASEGGPDE